jgi:non-specific serine/threonine protein kinase
MLETIREYALERLEASGEAEAIRHAHAAACLALAERADAGTAHEMESIWLDRLEADHDNMRAALAWALAPEREPAAGRLGLLLAASLWHFWFYHSHLSEGRRWLERALMAGAGAPDSARAKALVGLGTLVHSQGDEPRAVALLSEGVALSRKLGDPWSTAFALTVQGNLAEDGGRYDEAAALFAEAHGLFAGTGDRANVAVTLYHLGVVAYGQGDLARAEARCEEALALGRQLDDSWNIANALAYLGLIRSDQGDVAGAATALGEALTLYLRIGITERVAEVLRRVAVLAGARGESVRALRLFAAAETLAERIGAAQALPERAAYERAITAARRDFAIDAFAAAWAAGRALSPEQAVAEARDVIVKALAPQSAPNAKAPPSSAGLSPRELDVLRLLVQGRTDREIAEALFIAPRTAQTHVANLFAKLGVNARAEAAAVAVRRGLV